MTGMTRATDSMSGLYNTVKFPSSTSTADRATLLPSLLVFAICFRKNSTHGKFNVIFRKGFVIGFAPIV
jgi:hypothetical protein